METIIQQFTSDVITLIENLGEKLLNGSMQLSDFARDMKKLTDKMGRNLVKETLEQVDEELRESSIRKKEWYIEHRNSTKSIITVLGEVVYSRTYFVSKLSKEYKYLVDELFNITPHERLDQGVKIEIVEHATNLSYRKSGQETLVPVSAQTVMNTIKAIDVIKHEVVANTKKQVEVLYVEADEDHIHLQNGKGAMPKLIYVHEGIRQVSEKRNELINAYYIGGLIDSSNSLWEEVYEYIKNNYDLDALKTVYLSGDGAAWIKKGVNYLPKEKFVLDKFHIAQYIRKATQQNKEYSAKIWEYLKESNKVAFEAIMNELLQVTESKSKQKEIIDCKRYLLNNWDGVQIRLQDKDVIGCSAEGHISHIYSARMSSRPLGWSKNGADQMSKLRVYQANKADVEELFNIRLREKKAKEVSKYMIRNGISNVKGSSGELNHNIKILNNGKVTPIFRFKNIYHR